MADRVIPWNREALAPANFTEHWLEPAALASLIPSWLFQSPKPLPAAPVAVSPPAATLDTTAQIMRAFDPVIATMQGVSYPLAFLMVITGFILVMLGNRHKGLEVIKLAVIGYIGVQFVPALMRLVVNLGIAMRAAG